MNREVEVLKAEVEKLKTELEQAQNSQSVTRLERNAAQKRFEAVSIVSVDRSMEIYRLCAKLEETKKDHKFDRDDLDNKRDEILVLRKELDAAIAAKEEAEKERDKYLQQSMSPSWWDTFQDVRNDRDSLRRQLEEIQTKTIK